MPFFPHFSYSHQESSIFLFQIATNAPLKTINTYRFSHNLAHIQQK